MESVYVLYIEGEYDREISAHLTWESAEKALCDYIIDVTEESERYKYDEPSPETRISEDGAQFFINDYFDAREKEYYICKRVPVENFKILEDAEEACL